MVKRLLTLILIFCSIAGFGQTADTLKTYTLQSATIIAYQEKPVRKTSLNLLYGTEAIDGIINLVEEEKPAFGARKIVPDANMQESNFFVYNFFRNYIYLTPTNEDWFGFPVYRYKQQDATQYGAEFTLTIMPGKAFQGGLSYSCMVSKTADGNYTPFVPARENPPKPACLTSGRRAGRQV